MEKEFIKHYFELVDLIKRIDIQDEETVREITYLKMKSDLLYFKAHEMAVNASVGKVVQEIFNKYENSKEDDGFKQLVYELKSILED